MPVVFVLLPKSLSAAFDALIAEERILRPFAVDLDEAAELLVIRADCFHDPQTLAIDLQPCALHKGLSVLTDKVGEADGVRLAVVHGQITLADAAEVELLGDHLADRVLGQLHRHIVQTRLEDEDLLLHGVEIRGDALADALQVTVIILQRAILELKAVDLGDQVYHEPPLHIVI